MKKSKILIPIAIISLLLIILGIVLINLNKESYAIDTTIDPSTWEYVDGLGRTGHTNIKKTNKVRLVGMFYWPWHLSENNEGPYNLTEIMKNYPEAKNDYNHSVWKTNRYHWWNESIYGYYKEDDDYVLRKQAELLADAGVDFIVFDCTNGAFTWESAYENILEVWLEADEDGVNVPKVAFMFPFAYSEDTTAKSFMQIYNNLYNPNSSNYQKYKNLLFDYNGKPFVLMKDYKNANSEIKSILQGFEVRENYGGYFATDAQPNGSWGWLSTYPQAYYKKANGEPEQISVGVAMNASYVSHTLTAMNGKNVMGRSYAKDNYSYTYKYRNQTISIGETISGNTAKYTNTSLYGRNFQQQWDYAIKIDPEVVFVTGWNEWMALRFSEWQGITNAFPDQFNDEYSRDIEPSKGELKDYYYYQLVNNIRKYKGTSTQVSQNTPITINSIDDWNNSSIISYNHYVDGETRNIKGYGTTNPVTYTNNTFRNDIKRAKVSYDKSYIYFYVETKKDLTDVNNDKWMRLLIDTIESENSTSTKNWEEYEYILNRNNPSSKTMVLEKSTGGWNFETVGTVSYTKSGNILQVKVPRSYLGLTSTNIEFNFKWSDNNLDNGDIMTIYTDGDAAPGGRFAFHFSGKSDYEEENTEPDSGDNNPTTPDTGEGNESTNPDTGNDNPTTPDTGEGNESTNPDTGNDNPTTPDNGDKNDSTPPNDSDEESKDETTEKPGNIFDNIIDNLIGNDNKEDKVEENPKTGTTYITLIISILVASFVTMMIFTKKQFMKK